MGVHITGVYLMGGNAPHRRASHGHVSHGRVPYRHHLHLIGVHLTSVHLMGVYLITLFREWCSDEGLQGCELALLRAERCCHRHYGLALTPYRKRQERNEPSVVITET